MANFTLRDVSGSAIAVFAFATVLCAPGYGLAHAANLFGFRRQSLVERLLWSILCSLAAMPIVAYLAGRFAGLGVACAIAILLSFLAIALFVKQRLSAKIRWGWARREAILALSMACVWAAFVIGSLVDLQVGHKLYFSVAMFDQSYRVAFTAAVMRTGVPPANPLYFPGQAQPMRYYYFWYVLCAMVARIAHVSARQAFIASSVWSGFGLMAAIGLYTRYFLGVVRGVRRRIWIGLALLAVTGVDLLPAIGSLFAQKALNGEMEWWSNDQISSWIDSLLWVPHHVAALLCCLFSFLLLWRTREPIGRWQRLLAVTLAAVAFASAFGLSIYVAFGFAVLMLAWMARLLIGPQNERRENRRLCGRVVSAAALGALLLAPFVRELTAARSNLEAQSSAAHVFSLSIRRMIDPQLIAGLPALAAWNRMHPVLLDQALRLLLLPPGLALELGFYGAVLVLFALAWRRSPRRLDEAHRTAIYFVVCGLVMVLFVRSSVIGNNDFGYRAALLPQFFLLLLGGSLLADWCAQDREAVVVPRPWTRRMVYGLLALGLAGTVYQVLMLRLFLPIEEARPASGFAYLPAAAFEAREALGELARAVPATAVIEFDPFAPNVDLRGDVVTPFTFFTRALLLDSNRQILDSEPQCATQFGGDPEACAAMERATAQLYGEPALSAKWALEYCRRFGVDDLLVSRLDPAWDEVNGWASTLPVVAAEPDLRIVRCEAPQAAANPH